MDNLKQDDDYLKTLTVLFVEDDGDTREQLGMFLQRRVGALATADSGSSGLEAFRANRPHMVVTDIQMPGMDGLTMAQEIRKLDPAMPIIVTTAFEQTDYLLRSIDIGVDKYVIKPIDVGKLGAAMLQTARNLQAEEVAKRVSILAHQSSKLEALGAMAGGMAHDFNNILQVVLGSVEYALLCAVPDAEIRSTLERAQAGCRRAVTLGRTLLKLASGKSFFDSRAPLAPLVCESVSAVLGDTCVAVVYDLPGTLPTVAYNSGEVGMVFAQVAANARNAMPSGGTLLISGGRCVLSGTDALALPDGEYLHLSFKDTGMGISPEDLPKIFDPYLSTQEMGPQKGLGLGLTLCYSVIKRHGGLIVASSEAGCGAMFHIYLPVAV
jgi:signal transduction histidine kinase